MILIQSLLSSIQQTPVSTAIRRSDWAVMALEAMHLLGLSALGGAACICAMAAAQPAGLRGLPLATLTKGLRPLFGLGLLLMAASGLLIVVAMPFKYYLNAAFRVKMLLLLAAITVTAQLLRFGRSGAGPQVQRALALISGLLWLGVGFSGRLIGFL